MPRSPKLDPRPGDEFEGPMLKCKVMSIIASTDGVESVFYKVAHKDHEYKGDPGIRSIRQWVEFVGGPETIVTKTGKEL